ncbi:MAG: hypothetical protein ABII82_01495 [Verrucomicrobiota bacterium]
MLSSLLACLPAASAAEDAASVIASELGELPGDTASIAGWHIAAAFASGQSSLDGRVKITPAAHADRLWITLERLAGTPASPQAEIIAVTQAFVPARSPIWSRTLAIDVPFSLSVPEDLPAGRYRLRVEPRPGQRLLGPQAHDLARGDVPSVRSSLPLAVSGGGRNWKVVLPPGLPAESRLEAWLFIPAAAEGEPDLLAATASWELPEGGDEIALRLPDTPRWRAYASGVLRFQIGGTAAASALLTTDLGPASPASHKHKPITHGIYEQADGTRHYWHADDTHALHWNGSEWNPFGGMFYFFPAKSTLDERASERIKIHKLLDQLSAAGFRDLYVNAGVGHSSPDWFVQSAVDEFNRRGIRFGWQLTTGAKPFAAWEIYSSVSQGLLHAKVAQVGRLELDLPKIPLAGLLAIPTDGSGRAHRIEYSSVAESGRSGMEIAQILESENNVARQRVILDVPGLAPGDYYVLVNAIQRGKRLSNVWERLDETKAGLDWVSRINWGSGLRFFVDPVCNEGGINNKDETIRIASAAFEADFASWLRSKYQSSAALTAAWALPGASVIDFAQASRLLPVRDLDIDAWKNRLLLIDPQTGALFPTVGGPGASWMDYLQAVRESHALRIDEVARYIKARVNVPIVIKRVSPWVSTEGIPRAPGGVDGIGLELYPELGSGVPYGGLSGRAEADLASHTTWLLATELGYSSKPANRDVESWPDKATFERIVRETVSTGAKGIYLFGWRLPGKEWVNHVLLDQPDRLQWAREIADNLVANPPPVWSDYGLIYPEGQSWWWRSNGRLWTRYNSVYRNPPSVFPQSALLTGEGENRLWAVSSSVPVPGANPVVVNLTDAYFAKHYAKSIDGIIDAGKHIIYLGHWPENATTPARLARHFSQRKPVRLPDGRGEIQPLMLFPGDEPLAKDSSGNVWAKLNHRERILIVSATPAEPTEKNSAQPPRYLNPAWVERLLAD